MATLQGPKGRVLPTLRVIRNPRAAFEDWTRRYGDPFLVNALNGPIVLTGQPELIKQIFSGDPECFEPFAARTLTPIFGAGSMIKLNGEPHRRERRLMSPMFHGDRMKAYGEAIHQIALEEIEHEAEGAAFCMQPLATRVSYHVIVRTIFGGEDPTIVERMIDAGRRLLTTTHPLLFFSRRTHFHLAGFSPWDRFQRAIERLNAALDIEIDRREQDASQRGEDILSMLVGAQYEDGEAMTREHMRDELRTFLFAGHETSAIAITWAMYHLLRHPEVLARLREELDAIPRDAPNALAHAPYLKALVQETLRLHPIVPEVLRLLRKPFRLGEYDLTPGMAVSAAAALTHYLPSLYPEPDRFRPERFLERTYSPFEYLPFGGGQRRCIGAAFASFEIAIVLGTWLQHYDFELLDQRPLVPKRRNVTMGPSGPVRLRLKKRAS
ncbi:MAG: cytochrome P450 [Aureliella sp.]